MHDRYPTPKKQTWALCSPKFVKFHFLEIKERWTVTTKLCGVNSVGGKTRRKEEERDEKWRVNLFMLSYFTDGFGLHFSPPSFSVDFYLTSQCILNLTNRTDKNLWVCLHWYIYLYFFFWGFFKDNIYQGNSYIIVALKAAITEKIQVIIQEELCSLHSTVSLTEWQTFGAFTLEYLLTFLVHVWD